MHTFIKFEPVTEVGFAAKRGYIVDTIGVGEHETRDDVHYLWGAVMTTLAEQAVERFREGFNCAQAVFSTYAHLAGIDANDALRIATGFGAGMGRMQEVCGAATGAFMLIGCQHGMVQPADTAAKERAYALVQDFASRFQQLNGSLLCRDLLKCDLRTPEGKKEVGEKGLTDTVCVPCVRHAAHIVEDLLFSASVGVANPQV